MNAPVRHDRREIHQHHPNMPPPPGWTQEEYEYAREQMLDAAPSTETFDYFEEVGYESH